MTRFFLTCVGILFLLTAPSMAQTTVSVIGAVTPGDCAIFNSNTILKDAGFTCNGAPGGPAGGVLSGTYPNPSFSTSAFANPTGSTGLSPVNGAATTAMRSDGAPPLSATVQSALTATLNQLLIGTGAFGFSPTTTGTGVLSALGVAVNASGGIITPTPTRAGDVIFWNGSTWVTLAGNNSGTQVLSENASGVPAWSAAGSGTVTSVTCGTGLTGGTFTTTGTCALSLNSATIQSGPLNPSGTSSTTLVMQGLGATCHIAPTYSGRIFVQFIGVVFNSTAADSTRVQAYFGTGTAPSNAAAVTGTSIGPLLPISSSSANASSAFAAGGLVTGLTPGTAYWLDLAVDVNAGTGTAEAIFCSAHEIL